MDSPLSVWHWMQLIHRLTTFSHFSDLIAQHWQEQDYRSTQIGFDIWSFIP